MKFSELADGDCFRFGRGPKGVHRKTGAAAYVGPGGAPGRAGGRRAVLPAQCAYRERNLVELGSPRPSPKPKV